jgi:hypothetical protein
MMAPLPPPTKPPIKAPPPAPPTQRLEQKLAARADSNVDEHGERQQEISIVEILRSRRARREALAEPVARADGSDELSGQQPCSR